MDQEKESEVFVDAGLIDKDELKIVLEENEKNPEESLKDTLIRLHFATEKDVIRAFSENLNIPYIDLSTGKIDKRSTDLIPLNLACSHSIFPVRVDENRLILAMKDPQNMEVLDMARFASGVEISPYIAAPSQIEEAIQEYYNVEESISDYMREMETPPTLQIISNENDNEQDEHEIRERSKSMPIVQMVNSIIAQGISKKASDIHIEPQETIVIVRNRVDGIIQEAIRIPKWVQAALTSRIKIMAGMDIAEKRVPQDGRIKLKQEGKPVDLRISTLPTQHGEKIVIRILDTNKKTLTMGELGFLPDLTGNLREIINQPQGILLVCGPTGSGKTTTLYGLLSEIAQKDINIITLEDPIEYALKGVNQVQINEKAGLNFAKSLRSVLRQDPNVIFLGEIRDGETADIALRASMTGHLVLSTLHTNDAIATISRIIDLKIEPYLIASSLTGILAQRLVRTICPNCREEHEPNKETIKKVEAKLGEEISFLFYRGKGCEKCQQTGYLGRMGIHELLTITPEIREVIRSHGASESKIQALALKNGMKRFIDDALEKVKQGLTTIEEVERVIVFSDDDFQADISSCPLCQKNIEKEWKTCPFCSYILGRPDETSQSLKNPAPQDEDNIEAEKVSLKKGSDHRSTSRNRNRILLIDDDEDIVNSLAMFLLKNKFAVSVANNGKEALKSIKEEKPDLILTDIKMPEMDGYELIEKLREETSTALLPIIILSEKGEVEDKLKGFEVGTDDYLPKPFSPEEMLSRIKAVLKRIYT